MVFLNFHDFHHRICLVSHNNAASIHDQLANLTCASPWRARGTGANLQCPRFDLRWLSHPLSNQVLDVQCIRCHLLEESVSVLVQEPVSVGLHCLIHMDHLNWWLLQNAQCLVRLQPASPTKSCACWTRSLSSAKYIVFLSSWRTGS